MSSKNVNSRSGLVRTGNRDFMKEINLSIILNLIRSRGPLSRTDIAHSSGLSQGAVSGLTGELLASDFIRELGGGQSKGGRSPVLLVINPHVGFVVGIKLTDQAIVAAITDMEATIVHRTSKRVDGLQDPQIAIEAIIQTIETSLAESAIPRSKVIGVGIGLAGMIDSQESICTYSPILGWRQVQLAQPIEQRLQLPVYIENDVNALTIAENWFGAGRGRSHFLVATIGRGIGMGVVSNGLLDRGATGGAGEFGHITLQPSGPRCGCGKAGCLEALAGDPAVVRMAYEAVEAGKQTSLRQAMQSTSQLTLEHVALAAEQGDQVAQEILSEAGRWLGLGLSYLVNLFNPGLIVLSGEGTRTGDARIEAASQMMKQHIFDGLDNDLELVIKPMDDESWARGAACVVLSELFKHPINRATRTGLLGVV
ncbi:xylose repressor protein [Dictyobacter alpinus]|uniref:Xylose repressor protein n=1 Tax=Dictyobacter alpinus TaxID=2014873 RepID=A0A402BIR4_9CHLR|nr:ROK family protein [Dictyobacter alpinus]GCE31229.1 xylose repressor protein [Dictyobacter alpinus]